MVVGRVRQQYSHFTLEAEVIMLEAGKSKGVDWYDEARLRELPVSMAETKVMALLGLAEAQRVA